MDDAFVVRRFECVSNLPRDVERLIDRQSRSIQLHGRELVGECFAVDQLEHDAGGAVGLLETVHRGDIGVIQGREELRLALKSRKAFRVSRELLPQKFDRNRPSELGVAGTIDLAHAAGA